MASQLKRIQLNVANVASGTTADYRLAWRKQSTMLVGQAIFLRLLRNFRTAIELNTILSSTATDAFAGEYLFSSPKAEAIYTDAALLRAWSCASTSLPCASIISLWRDADVRRRRTADLICRLRNAFARAVGCGLLSDLYATSVISSAEREAMSDKFESDWVVPIASGVRRGQSF